MDVHHTRHLDDLADEAVTIIREVATECENPVLLFSGGKDSAVLLHLAVLAFAPARLPFPVMHVDTGHNFTEVIEYRDEFVERVGARLVVASVQQSIDDGRVVEDAGPRASRNRLQSVTLLDAIAEHGFDAAFGGGRRDEDKARAKERILSFRDRFGRWDPRAQRPEPWDLLNARIRKGEHLRAFPLSNWTELDIWQFIKAEDIPLPSIYFSHRRLVVPRDGMLLVGRRSGRARARRGAVRGDRALPHRRRRELHRCRPLAGQHDRRGHRRGRHRPDHRARRHPGRRHVQRVRHGRPQARGVLLMTDLLEADVAFAVSTMPTLRIATAGSVDDGKSTLIGRLLHDTKTVMEDQLAAVHRASARYGVGPNGDTVNLALLTDGLRAEREQGITIDVAHRYFATPARSFIVADTPGHAQYTRNMVTGASNADIAIVLVDARHGVVEQTRRHAFISSLLGVHTIALAVNKMDLVDFDEAVFDVIVKELSEYVDALPTPVPVVAFPISALLGDNVVDASPSTPWYDGPALLSWLEQVDVDTEGIGADPPRRAAGHPAAGVGLPRLRRAVGRRSAGCRRRGHGACRAGAPPRSAACSASGAR